MEALLKTLYQSIQERWRPEDVARTILEYRKGIYKGTNLRRLQGASKHAFHRSHMYNRFAQAEDLGKQIRVARDLFPDVQAPSNRHDPVQVEEYLDRLDKALGIEGNKPGHDFLADRRNRRGRAVKRLQWRSRRSYNKRFRLLARMRDKLARWRRISTIRALAQVAKSRLAYQLTWDEFSADVDTGCFIAYMTARLNVRSTFTWGKQQRPFDTVAHMLMHRIGPNGNWLAVAHVHPAAEVMDNLTDEQKGAMLGKWFEQMKTASGLLEGCLAVNNIDLVGLVVRRGNDSSTWNESAGAFNKCRDGWISALHALGADSLLDRFAPPKALRLMAADVVYMHRAHGSGGLEPDTAVWNDLPFPWEVMTMVKSCTRADIEAACQKHGVKGKGWIVPRPKTVVDFNPTPELVHGVIIESADLAKVLRKCGYYSGPSKGVKALGPPVTKQMVGDVMVVTEGEQLAAVNGLP